MADSSSRSRKRPRGDQADLSTLAVYTYHGPLAAHNLPASRTSDYLIGLQRTVFGQREPRFSVFSITSSSTGDFLMMDEPLHRELFGGGGTIRWNCLYIHEATSARTGAEISGSLSALCDHLAEANIPVLNICTLARNFMIVRETVAPGALTTLHAALVPPSSARHIAKPGDNTGADGDPSRNSDAQNVDDSASDGSGARRFRLTLELKREKVIVGSLSVAELKACCHALLTLFFLRRTRPTFQHFFEMAGEASLIVEESALEALRQSEPASSEALLAALKPSLSRGWRVLSITAPCGSEGVGLLGAVCLPLSRLPLLNVSTLDESFVLIREEHLSEALRLLGAAGFDVAHEGVTL